MKSIILKKIVKYFKNILINFKKFLTLKDLIKF